MISKQYEQECAKRNEVRALLRTLEKGSEQYKHAAMQMVSLNVRLRDEDKKRAPVLHTKKR